MDVSRFRKLPLMGILRGLEKSVIRPLAETVIEAGLQTIEITMNTQDAPDLIKAMIQASGGLLTVGAGTVLTSKDLHSALDAGASFIVSPVFIPKVVEECVQKNMPVFPGAMTPQEIYRAWTGGASMVKVFPSKFFGPAYIKEIKGPFNDIELLACGGVTQDTIGDFFKNGASGVAFGGSIFRKEWIPGNLPRIKTAIKALIEACKQA